MRLLVGTLLILLTLSVGCIDTEGRKGSLDHPLLFPSPTDLFPKLNASEIPVYSYAVYGLQTNGLLASIPFEKINSSGPGKDGIPALRDPLFTDVYASPMEIRDDSQGIAVGDKFYPLQILLWHEAVNDELDGVPILVSYYPLSGTAAVYDRRVKDRPLDFGVSGLVYQSNPLLFDRATESLWSQVLGRCLVGDLQNQTLSLLPSSVLSFSQFKRKFPNGRVLSTETNFSRNYSYNPYADFPSEIDLRYPTDPFDKRIEAKTMVYAIPLNGTYAVFPLELLRMKNRALMKTGDSWVEVVNAGGEMVSLVDGKPVSGFTTMYFAVAVHAPGLYLWDGRT